MTMNKVCANCNSVNRTNAFYCYACGNRLLTTILPGAVLAAEKNSPASPPEPSKANDTRAEIKPDLESHDIDDHDNTEIYHDNQKTQANQEEKAKLPAAFSDTIEIKAEAEVSDIPTGELIPEEEKKSTLSTSELQTPSGPVKSVVLSLADKARATPELPSSMTNHEKMTSSEALASQLRSEIAPDNLPSSSTVVSFNQNTANSLSERQTTTFLTLAPELESKDTKKVQTSSIENDKTKSSAATSLEKALTTTASEGQLSALPPGTLIAKRFETIKLLQSSAQSNLYLVYDRVICPSCRSTENQLEDNYCWECGFDLSRKHELVTSQLREALLHEQLEPYEGERFVDHQRFYLRLSQDTTFAKAAATEAVQSAPKVQNLTLSVGYQSHLGMVRKLNEDSLSVFILTSLYESLSQPTLGLFMVADGMGGHAGGEIASKFVTQTITDRLVRRVLLDRFNDHSERLEAVKPRIEEAIRYANEQLHRLAQERQSDMGTTVTLVLVINHKAYIANVGDSRVYIHRDGKLQQITTDHSVVASLIATGMVQPDEIYTHPQRNMVYRSMGNQMTVELDMWEEELKKGDQLLLCSDGLWEAIRNEGIEEVLLIYTDAQAASEEMIRRANLAGGQDNITVILAQVG